MLRKWFVMWHGEGAKNQCDLYRCTTCNGIVTWKNIRSGGCKCKGNRMKPTNPRLFEALRLMLFPWTY